VFIWLSPAKEQLRLSTVDAIFGSCTMVMWTISRHFYTYVVHSYAYLYLCGSFLSTSTPVWAISRHFYTYVAHSYACLHHVDHF